MPWRRARLSSRSRNERPRSARCGGFFHAFTFFLTFIVLFFFCTRRLCLTADSHRVYCLRIDSPAAVFSFLPPPPARMSDAASQEEDAVSLPERECPICRDDFAAGDKVIKMPCSHSHVFHQRCVAEWLERDDSCPMCRSALPVWLGRPQYA